MSRIITINSVKAITSPTTTFDPVTGTGKVASDYVVANTTNGVTITYPSATINGHAEVAVDSTHTAPELYQALALLMLAQENLSFADGDSVLFA